MGTNLEQDVMLLQDVTSSPDIMQENRNKSDKIAVKLAVKTLPIK